MRNTIIFGGSGSFGTRICDKMDATIFSRNETLQFKHKQSHPNCDYVIGDIRDYEAVKNAINHDYVILASAMKHIDKCEENPLECIKTNVLGCINVINAAIEKNVKKLIFLSTDKATNPTTLYGCSKFLVELYLRSVKHEGDFITTRYGNVFGSNGSVAYVFDKLAKEGKPLTVTNPDMTRFFMSIDQAVDLVLYALKHGKDGDIWVYNNKSATIRQIAELFSYNYTIEGNRCVEKNDEALLTASELSHSYQVGDYICVNANFNGVPHLTPMTSDLAPRLSKEELQTLLDVWKS